MAAISTLRRSSSRARKELSQPKNLTKRTDCRISCVSDTRWSVVRLMAFAAHEQALDGPGQDGHADDQQREAGRARRTSG